jgi:Ca2+-binding EF-hand superfamily protein
MKKFLLGSGIFLAATAAAAQVAPYAPSQTRDGTQTRAEAVNRARTMFSRVDANRDGFINMAEAQALRGQVRGSRAQRGQRSADPARRAQAFERLDANRDNMISRDEWARADALREQRRADGQRGGMRGHRMAMRGRMGAMLRAADANRDQRISLQEAEAAALQRFDRLDLNRDGRITRDERWQLREQRQLNRTAPQPVR